MKMKWPWAPKPTIKKKTSASKAPSILSTHLHFGPMDPAERIAMLTRTFQRRGPKPGKNGNWTLDAAGMDAQVKTSMTAGQFGVPDEQLAWYAGQGFPGYQILAMLCQNWLIDKAVTMPAKDAVRNGFDITASDGTEVKPEVFDFIRQRDKRYKLRQNMVDFIRYGRMFGIRVAMFKVDVPNPQKYYELPYNPDGIRPGSYRGISQIDPYWMAPVLDTLAASDPSAINFYQPTWWIIGGMKVHHTHLIISVPNPVADILKPTYLYGGISTPQKIYERVYAAERTANEAPLLAMTKRTIVMFTDLTQAIADQEKFEERMGWWSRTMNNFGIKIVGEGDKVEQHDTSLSDLDAAIMTQFQLVAAASDTPATKLLGTQPKGFNATGEFEESSYHEFLEGLQEHDLTPLVNRHHEMVIRSDVKPKFGLTFSTDISWLPLDAPTALEQAQINESKSATDVNLVNAGAITPMEVRERLVNDPGSGYNGLDLDIEPEDLLEPLVGEEGEEGANPGEEKGAEEEPAAKGKDAKAKKPRKRKA